MGRNESSVPTLRTAVLRLETVEDLGRLYEAEHLQMFRLARLITGSPMLAEEAVHDAFITVFHRRADIEQPGAYLRRVVVNNCNSVLRRRTQERKKIEFIGNQRGDVLALPPELEETWDALHTLKPKQRTALVLRYHQDLPLQAVADVMDERLGTVKSLIHRGLKQLRSQLGDESEPRITVLADARDSAPIHHPVQPGANHGGTQQHEDEVQR